MVRCWGNKHLRDQFTGMIKPQQGAISPLGICQFHLLPVVEIQILYLYMAVEKGTEKK